MNRTILIALALFSLFAGSAPLHAAGSAEVALELLTATGAETHPCDDDYLAELGNDRFPACGRAGRGAKQFQSALATAVEKAIGPNATLVFDWSAGRGQGVRRAVYWLGVAFVEAEYHKKTSEVRVIVSKIYERCGPEIVYLPPGFQSETGAKTITISVAPASYPPKAFRKKIDGTVAVAVDVGSSGALSVRCIHHVSPPGLGFEYSALESVYHSPIMLPEDSEIDGPIGVLVKFSRAADRRGSIGAKYH